MFRFVLFNILQIGFANDFLHCNISKSFVVLLLKHMLSTQFQMKCLKYWPDIAHTLDFGPYTIALNTEDVYDSYTLRTISLKYEVC